MRGYVAEPDTAEVGLARMAELSDTPQSPAG
jgi:hypothetical protein